MTKKSRQEYQVSGNRNRQPQEQVKCCHDTDCNEPTTKKGFTALKNGNWEEYTDTRSRMVACPLGVNGVELVSSRF